MFLLLLNILVPTYRVVQIFISLTQIFVSKFGGKNVNGSNRGKISFLGLWDLVRWYRWDARRPSSLEFAKRYKE